MKANEFVKKYGWGEAKRVVNDSTEQCTHYDKIKNNDFWFDNNLRLEWCSFECRWCSPRFQINESELVSVDDLKRIVESHDLVESYGGLEDAKKELQRQSILRWINPETERLRAAIADVESCEVKND